MTFFIPLELPHDLAEHGGGAHGYLEPLMGLGVVTLVLVALLAALLLRARGLLPAMSLPGWLAASRVRPEDSAKQILAERLAHGDLSTEEFMERASVLNWTPGVEAAQPRSIGRG